MSDLAGALSAATVNESRSDSGKMNPPASPRPGVQTSMCYQRQYQGIYVAEPTAQAAFPMAAAGTVEGASSKSMQLWYQA